MLAASAAVSTAGAVASHVAQSRAAKAQGKFQADRYNATASAAQESYFDDLSRFQLRMTQEDEAASQSARELAAQAERSRGQAAASAGARGVSGVSVDELVQDFSRLEAEELNSINRNREMLREQIGADMRGVRARYQSSISSAAPQPVTGPSPLALGLNIAGIGLNALNKNEERKLRTP